MTPRILLLVLAASVTLADTAANALGNGGLASAPTFTGPGSVNFNVDTVLTSQFTRDAAGGGVDANFIGPDSGTIKITYTTIPETGAALLGSIGVLLLLRRRR